MSKLTLVSRILLGVIFAVFGMNGFLHFLPMPAMQGAQATFFSGLIVTGYFLPLLAGAETICGILLLANVYVPLALIVLAPIILNIVLFHVFLSPEGIPLAIVVAALETYLAFFATPYRGVVRQIFTKKS